MQLSIEYYSDLSENAFQISNILQNKGCGGKIRPGRKLSPVHVTGTLFKDASPMSPLRDTNPSISELL
jgi:hypothetical protein